MSAVAGHLDLVECRTTALGSWMLGTRSDGGHGGLLRVTEDVPVQRLVTVTGRLRDLDLPGILPITDLVRQRGRIWLVTALPPTPALAELLGEPDIGPGQAVDVLQQVAQAVLELHAADLVHGSVGADAVVIGADGAARLVDWGLPGTTGADVVAWAELAWFLARSWCASDVRSGAVLSEAAVVATSGGLGAALEVLRGPSAVTRPVDPGRLARVATERVAALVAAGPGSSPVAGAPAGVASAAAAAPARPPQPASPPAPLPPAPATTSPVAVATQLGARRAGRFGAAPSPPRPDGVRRFGPGVPAPAGTNRAEELWRSGAAPRRRPRRPLRAAASLVLTLLVVAAAVLVGLWARQPAVLAVTGAEVRVDPRGPECDGTAEITGVISTNGGSGAIEYRWVADGTRSVEAERPLRVDRQGTVVVTLRWPMRDAPNGEHEARLEIVAPQRLDAEQRFVYRCPGLQ